MQNTVNGLLLAAFIDTCVDLQNMGLDLSGSDLADTKCERLPIGRHLAVSRPYAVVTAVWLTTEADKQPIF